MDASVPVKVTVSPDRGNELTAGPAGAKDSATNGGNPGPDSFAALDSFNGGDTVAPGVF
jgi:hypothetical protein